MSEVLSPPRARRGVDLLDDGVRAAARETRHGTQIDVCPRARRTNVGYLTTTHHSRQAAPNGRFAITDPDDGTATVDTVLLS